MPFRVLGFSLYSGSQAFLSRPDRLLSFCFGHLALMMYLSPWARTFTLSAMKYFLSPEKKISYKKKKLCCILIIEQKT